MKSTKKKAVASKKSDEIFANGRVWTKEQLSSYREYQKEYIKSTYRSFLFRCNSEKESDLIEWLQMQDNLAAYLKDLVRADMDKKKGGQ